MALRGISVHNVEHRGTGLYCCPSSRSFFAGSFTLRCLSVCVSLSAYRSPTTSSTKNTQSRSTAQHSLPVVVSGLGDATRSACWVL